MSRTRRGFLLLAATWAVLAGCADAVRSQNGNGATVAGANGAATDEIKRLQGMLTRTDSSAASRQDAAALLMARMPDSRDVLLAALQNGDNVDVPLAVLKALSATSSPDAAFLDAMFRLAATETLDAKIAKVLPRAMSLYRGKTFVETVAERIEKSKRPAEKVILIAALGQTGEKEAVAPLIDLLKDREATVRRTASDALARITLIDTFGESHPEWSRWWRENGRKPREAWLALQLAALKAQSKAMAARLDQQETMTGLLTRRLVEVHRASWQTLAPEARKAEVLKLLDDAVPQLRLLAAREARSLLTAAPDKVLVDKLLLRLADTTPAVGARAAAALAVSKDERVAPILLKRFDETQDLVALAAVVDALGELREAKAVPHLQKLLDSPTDQLVIRAAGALARIGQRNAPMANAVAPAIPKLCRLLKVGDGARSDAVREAVARAMVPMGRKDTADTLVEALDDTSGKVRFSAAKALGSISDVGATTIDALLKRMRDNDRGVRSAVAITLGKLGDGKVSQAVAEQLLATDGEKDPEVRTNLWQALVIIQKRQSDPAVTSSLGDRFAAQNGKGRLAEAIELYEIAVAKFSAASGNGRLHALQLKLANVYLRASQPAKAAPILQDLLKGAKDDAARATFERQLARARMRMSPYVAGVEALAQIAIKAPDDQRDAMLREITDHATSLHSGGAVADAYAVMSKAREVLQGTWAGSPEAGRMAALLQRLARAVFDQALKDLSSPQEAARKRAAGDLAQLTREWPEVMLSRLQAALEAKDAARVKQIEPLLAETKLDASGYQAAKTLDAKLKAVRAMRDGGPATVPGERDKKPD
jgi:HEAT repeat protein